MKCRLVAPLLLVMPGIGLAGPPPEVSIGSKKFTESVILGEIVAHLVSNSGGRPTHRSELGGTRVLFSALVNGDIDIYPEYTGTITEEIFAGRELHTVEDIRDALAGRDIRMSRPLGFNNTYALGMNKPIAARLGIRTISDLRAHTDLILGFGNEFMARGDGWPALRDRYGLTHRNVRGLDHDLGYRALQAESIDVMDMYSTDAEIRYYDLAVLADDLEHFPAYHAVLLYRKDLATRAPACVAALKTIEDGISTATMSAMNARAKLDGTAETEVAADFLRANRNLHVEADVESIAARIGRRTKEHLYLVIVSMVAAVLLGIPLGVVAAKKPRIGQVILAAAGILQTIPSLALLVLLMVLLRPLRSLGVASIGAPPAIVALFLYSLLPIVRNTYTGLRNIDIRLRESAAALGLPGGARLRLVELPMASPMILAGIKTATVINIGFATLGAFIGAGGYGQPILTGIRLDNVSLILQGAVPAAALALVTQGLFEAAERVLVPMGLRLKAHQ